MIFSNTQILGPYPNHLVLPPSLIIFNKDLVSIVDSKDPVLKSFAISHSSCTLFGFRKLIRKAKGDYFVRILYRGKVMTLSRKDEGVDPLMKPPGWFEWKLFYSYTFPNGHCLCH